MREIHASRPNPAQDRDLDRINRMNRIRKRPEKKILLRVEAFEGENPSCKSR
jgi:hypothetical protein